jgi:hypothetical protein
LQENRPTEREIRMTYRFGDNPLVHQVFSNPLDELHLFLRIEACDGHLDHTTQRDLIYCNETVVVHVCEETHDKLAIRPIGDASMSRDRVTKVLDLERALQTRGKETTKRRNEGREGAEDEDVYLHWGHREGLCVRKPDWEVVDMWDKDRVWGALEAGPDVCSEILRMLARPNERSQHTYIYRADEIFIPHQDIGHPNAKEYSEHPSSNEPLHGLLWR